jgi:hypothetical protein
MQYEEGLSKLATRAKLATIALWAFIAVSALTVGVEALEAANGAIYLETEMDTRALAFGLTYLAYTLVFVVSIVLVGLWIHRAHANLRESGADGLEFTPGWAVGWYFVPIMSLWKPFQAMREIWQASAAPGNWQSVQTPPLLGWWWALYLGANILGQIGLRLSKNIDSVDSAITASAFITAADSASVALDAAALLVVMKIAANQVWQTKTVEVF